MIPPVEEDEEETCPVNEWLRGGRSKIMLGELKPQTRGGKSTIPGLKSYKVGNGKSLDLVTAMVYG